MQFDFLEKMQDITRQMKEENRENDLEISDNLNIDQIEIELAKKLNAIEEFSVDRFEEKIVVLENRENGKKINVEKNRLPEGIKEGDILKSINGKYSLDKVKTLDETSRIKNKMDDLWN